MPWDENDSGVVVTSEYMSKAISYKPVAATASTVTSSVTDCPGAIVVPDGMGVKTGCWATSVSD